MERMEEDVLEEMEGEGIDLDGLFKERDVCWDGGCCEERGGRGYEFGRRSLVMKGL